MAYVHPFDTHVSMLSIISFDITALMFLFSTFPRCSLNGTNRTAKVKTNCTENRANSVNICGYKAPLIYFSNIDGIVL